MNAIKQNSINEDILREMKSKAAIVDDQLHNLRMASNILKNMGVEVIGFESGEELLEYLENNYCDIVLLDIMMPKMNGYEVCKTLKQNPATSEIPVIFLTAKTESEDIVEGFNAGAIDYITKPFDFQELALRIKTHIKIHQHYQEMKKENQRKSDILNSAASQLEKPLKQILSISKIYNNDINNTKISDITELANSINSAANKALNISEALICLEKLENNPTELNCQEFDIVELIEKNQISYTSQALIKNIEFNIEKEVDETTIFSDKDKHDRIIDNLFSIGLIKANDSSQVRIVIKEENKDNLSYELIINNPMAEEEKTDQQILQKLFIKKLCGSLDGNYNEYTNSWNNFCINIVLPKQN